MPLTRVTVGSLLIPAMLGGTLVLGAYAETAIHWVAVMRPLLIVATLGFATAAITLLVTRQPLWAAIVGSLAVSFGLGDNLLGWVIVELSLAWLVVRQVRRIRRTPLLAPPIAPLATIAALLVAVSVVTLALRGTITGEDFQLAAQTPPVIVSEVDGPSIYVLLLDAYPRVDSQAHLGIDTRPFLADLERKGFTLYHDATSDYSRTELSLISMLSDLPAGTLNAIHYPEWPAIVETWRHVRRTFFYDLPAMHTLRSLGYRLVYVRSPIGHTDLPGWDVEIDTGQLTGFEVDLLQRSPLAHVLGQWVLEQHQDRIEASLHAWSDQARNPEPQAVLAHVLAPHTPFVYLADGSTPPPLACWSLRWCSIYQSSAEELHLTMVEYVELLAGQMAHLNRLVLTAVDEVISANPDAVIVVLSDHGARYSAQPQAEWHHSFLAARVPGHPDALAEDPSANRLFVRLIELVVPVEESASLCEGSCSSH